MKGDQRSKCTALVIGYPYFARMIGELLPHDLIEVKIGVESRPLQLIRDVLRADVVYIIGGSLTDWRRLAISRLSPGKVIMHWVGTDVLLACAASSNGKARRSLRDRITHWAEVSWTANELKDAGIDARIVPLTSTRIPSQVPRLPEIFTVLAYLKDSQPQFYGSESIIRLAYDLPEVTFLVVGSSGRFLKQKPSNISFLGWVDDMASLYARTTILVRMTQHDGLAFMVLESLAYGRYVVWSYPFEGALFVQDYEMMKAHIQELFLRHQVGRLPLNEAGIRKVRDEFDPSAVGRRLTEELIKVAFSWPGRFR